MVEFTSVASVPAVDTYTVTITPQAGGASIAVDSAGKRERALALLRSANKRHPNDLDILSALLSISRETGDRQAALRYAKQLAEILPGNPALNRLIAELEAK